MTTKNPRFGHDVLCVFDVWQNSRDFLADVIESVGAPAEAERLLRQSLTAGADDWQYLIECAESIRRARGGVDEQSLDGQDLLTFVWEILNKSDAPSFTAEPWKQTDILIAKAKALEQDPELWSLLSVASTKLTQCAPSSQPTAKSRNNGATTSHYWLDQSQSQYPTESRNWSRAPQLLQRSTFPAIHFASLASDIPNSSTLLEPIGTSSPTANREVGVLHSLRNRQINVVEDEPAANRASSLVKRSSAISPYFPPSSTIEGKKLPDEKRPPAGILATVPFAPLTSSRFGIVQELFAHDPFWLLIAVTFLVKTKGKVAMPVFYKVKERFPTPADIVNPSNKGEIVSMIRHLGLSSNRVAFMQKYARGFLEDPPKPDVRYKVRNYDSRDVDPSARALGIINNNLAGSEPTSNSMEGDVDDLDMWEIGHLTKGKYALDSWRIFCRDELLGRAEDWNGKGREAEFQPEWMRVMPHDKELRAYLRWMWMREGWEWDPNTGERTVLREEMRRAVNEGRVEYDYSGGLRILDNEG